MVRVRWGVAAAGCLIRGEAEPQANPIGCQTWPFRETIGNDFDRTLRRIASDGYQTIEMCSPPGYERYGFGPLASLKASEMRGKIQAAGLQCESCHYGFAELKEHLDERVAYAHELGLKQMIISTFALPTSATVADWIQAADEANKLGERAKRAGLQLGFHNHDFEFHKIEGELIYDKLMGAFDPAAVKMQFQIEVVRLGYRAAEYFERYSGRFVSIHLSDWSAADADGKEVPLGQGVVDWRKTFTAARRGGVKNYFLEMDPANMKASLAYLRGLSSTAAVT